MFVNVYPQIKSTPRQETIPCVRPDDRFNKVLVATTQQTRPFGTHVGSVGLGKPILNPNYHCPCTGAPHHGQGPAQACFQGKCSVLQQISEVVLSFGGCLKVTASPLMCIKNLLHQKDNGHNINLQLKNKT